ncbi:hypothetical protein LTR36_008427 [Oleoguttula mirabilis]|uniref:WSC domain-containing protein n=1 Tax=Oleoguttula mirabilis TaxID=1507867 RepID=A0AAV9J895_9PEZI|nr:hypothetical protein LTR36_008427 [Oleoguttula mirabilis]
MRSHSTVYAVAALFFLAGVDAFFRLNCAIIQTGRVDPLVNPGTVAAHAHTIVGGSNIGVNATGVSLSNSACSSCQVQADKSAYWTPILYYQYPNGSFYEVPHSGSVVYYLGRGQNATTIPFPPGFKMLSGNKALRSYDNQTMTWGNASYAGEPVANRISFACLTAGTSPPSQPYMFNVTQCINGMRAQIAFQGCWNGIDLYKADNSHVAYLSGIDNGVCPPGYEYQLPVIFVETDYAVSQVPGATNDSAYTFSQGDPTGFGFHGDFQNGWDQEVLTDAVNDCLTPGDPSGQVQYCPALYASDTNGASYNCPEQPPQIGEPVRGLIDKLPGCVVVTPGPDSAMAAQMNCAVGVPLPSITSTVDSTPRPTASPTPGATFGLPDHEYLGCYNDTNGFISTLNEVSYTNYTVMTVEWCQQYCMNLGYRLSGVEYAQECHCDNEINPTALNANNQTTNQCTWACGGTLTANADGVQELCGGVDYINVYNNTNSSFNAFGDMSNTAGNASPYTLPAAFAANYLGCYTDNSNTGRTLTGVSISLPNMTIAYCAQHCNSAGPHGTGYQYYGLEFASQCYCGNAISTASSLLTALTSPSNSSCQDRCVGSEPEICGGGGVLSMYNNTGFVAPAIKPSVGKYLSGQCLLDPSTGGRGLQGAAYSNSTNMTVERCIKFCLGKYYHYAGIEYGYECYCGNSIVASTGNTIEYCGGSGFMNLYYSPSL